MKKRTWLFIAAGVFTLLLAAIITFLIRPDLWHQALVQLSLEEQEESDVTASGFIEAEEINVAPEVGGRIQVMNVEEGDEVEAGDVLAQLDDTLVQAQVEVAQAGVDVAKAMLAQVQAGARPEQIRQAEAALAQAQAGREGAYQAWQDALAILENPQDLNAQIALAQSQLDQAEAGVQQALAMRQVAEIANDAFTGAIEEHPPGESYRILVAAGSLEDIWPNLPPEILDFVAGLGDGTYTYESWEITLSGGSIRLYRNVTVNYPLQAHMVPTEYWRAWAGYNTAEAAREGAERALATLYDMRNDPQQIQAQVDAAEAQYRAAQAAVEMAQAQLDGLEAGATQQEIAAAEARVQQAQSELESALVLLQKQTLEAPGGGWVLETIGHVGELAAPGVALITLADLDEVTLTVYVPENRLGYVQIGQAVQVRVDSFPDRVFVGHVASIANQAEFTPRNVQTQEERVNMVFAVQVLIPNPDHALKPGMPADALIQVEEVTQ
ncbi:MAG: efflux RND transporter periplasmic adaptor subunit [Anaerolineae bacterium]|jgi:multidrug resistance efflux pump